MSDEKEYSEEDYIEGLTEEELNDTLNSLKGKFVIIEDLNNQQIKGTLVEYDGNTIKLVLELKEGKSEVDIPLSEITSLTWVYEEDGEIGTYTLEF